MVDVEESCAGDGCGPGVRKSCGSGEPGFGRGGLSGAQRLAQVLRQPGICAWTCLGVGGFTRKLLLCCFAGQLAGGEHDGGECVAVDAVLLEVLVDGGAACEKREHPGDGDSGVAEAEFAAHDPGVHPDGLLDGHG